MSMELIEKAKAICSKNESTEFEISLSRILNFKCGYRRIKNSVPKAYDRDYLFLTLPEHDAEVVYDAAGFIIKNMELTEQSNIANLIEARELCDEMIKQFDDSSIVETFFDYRQFLDFQLNKVENNITYGKKGSSQYSFNFEVACKEVYALYLQGNIIWQNVEVLVNGLEAIEEFKRAVYNS